jgi:hypothetical protein
MLFLLIANKESVKNNNINIYMAPLVEKLQELWKGVDVGDVIHP